MKRLKYLLVVVFTILIILPTAAFALAPTEAYAKSGPSVDRIAGQTRYDTAAAISKEAFSEGAKTVIVATGENFPDALAASGLAGILDCPVVLTQGASLSSEAKSEIARLGAKKVYIAGGTGAVSTGVEKALAKMVGAKNVTRLAGSSRYQTSMEIFGAGSGWGDTAIVATGANYPDALSISGYAYANQSPIFLADPGSGLSSDAQSALKGFKRVIIVGGTGVVSANVESTLKGLVGTKNVTRLSGSDRFGTSLAIAEFAKTEGMHAQDACIATGYNFPDALAGGPLVGKRSSVMLLADMGGGSGYDALKALRSAGTDHATALGGTGAVPEAVCSKAKSEMPKASKADISVASVAPIASQPYTGSAITPKPKVTLNGKTLKAGIDYTVSYKNNVNVGTASVTVTGKGSYTGTKAATFKIIAAGISKAIIGSIDHQPYTGSAIEPQTTVVVNGKTLKEGTDYTVSYKNNVNAGTASVTVTGKGNYTGTKAATFEIAPASISKASVGSIDPQPYTGSAITPKPTVTFNGKTLEEGTDYTVSYENNVNAGTASVTVTGKGNYTGDKTTTFVISPIDISGATIGEIDLFVEYTGSAIAPSPDVTLNGMTLTKDTDYSLSYTGNDGRGMATVTVTGTGNYAGTVAKRFLIYETVNGKRMVTLGAYEQDNNASNGKEPIEWRVLAASNGEFFLVSEYGLDCKTFNDDTELPRISWEWCDLKFWLQDDFAKAAGLEEYASSLACLRKSEVTNTQYFANDNDRKCVPTAYAVAKGVVQSTSYFVGEKGTCQWWLRDTDATGGDTYAKYVFYSGKGNDNTGCEYTTGGMAVRPALRMNL